MRNATEVKNISLPQISSIMYIFLLEICLNKFPSTFLVQKASCDLKKTLTHLDRIVLIALFEWNSLLNYEVHDI